MRGGKPEFTVYHVIRALEHFTSEIIGRPRLQRLLNLGEASAKTLISRMREVGLIEARGRGSRATVLGYKVLEAISESLRYGIIGYDLDYWGEPASYVALTCASPPRSLTEVYMVRDYIVAETCRNTVIVGGISGRHHFPGLPKPLMSHVASVLEDLDLKGLILVVPQSCLSKAVSGVAKLLAEKCPCKPPG
jgi:hypothetical protein